MREIGQGKPASLRTVARSTVMKRPAATAAAPALAADGTLDVFPNHPEDALDLNVKDKELFLRVTSTIKDAGNELFKAGDFEGAKKKYIKAIRYSDFSVTRANHTREEE